MTAREEVQARHPGAFITTRKQNGKAQFRAVGCIASLILSGWCQSEERAWQAARQRMAHRANNRESW